MKKHLFIFFIFCISTSSFCQTNIINPQDWWGDQPASMENVEIEMRTIGAYSETSIAFDLFLGDSYFFEGIDLLEFTFDFELNEGAVVNDSWLWINDYISKGEVYEQGEGTQIYESIVDRQQDPSILTQVTSTDYHLRVYPLKWDSSRRVRLSYLEPLDYSGKRAIADLPLGLLRHSDISPENIVLKIYDDINYSSEDLDPNVWNVEEEGVDYKIYKNKSVFERGEFKDIPVAYDFSNVESNYFLSTYEGLQDNYYQLVYYPSIANENKGEHRMIIFDYDYFSSDKSFEEIKSTVRSALASMDEEDYFIICYNDFVTQFSSDNWLLATSENIEIAISNIEPNSIIVESRLPVLISESLTKIEALKQDSKLIIVSPNNEYYKEDRANAFLSVIDQFYSTMETKVNISVMDYTKYKTPWVIDGIDYAGNDFLYKNLTEEFEGVHYNTHAGDEMHSSLVNLFTKNIEFTEQYDFQIGLENGFTYSNFLNIHTELPIGSGKPIISVGKYIGDGLFDIKLSAKIGDEVFADSQIIDSEISTKLDVMAESIWNGEWIKSLQSSNNSEDRNMVIQKSIEERLLSLHTVFLCLEPELESISENNNSDGEVVLSTTVEEQKPEFKFNIYPNPFLDKFTIEFPIDDVSQVDQIRISLLDSRGQLIDRFYKINGLVNGINTIDYESEIDLADGLYIVQIEFNNTMYNQKILHLRS